MTPAFLLAALALATATGSMPVRTLALPGGVTIVEDASGEAPRYAVRVNGRAVGGWTGEGFDASHELRGTRHGDQVLVASRTATSNGIGVEAWTFAAFTLRGDRPIGAPVRWGSADWGASGDGVRVRGGALEVLATDWDELGDGSGSLRFVGGWFRVAGPRLVPVAAWRARRYLFSFERERIRDPRPAHWLARRTAPVTADQPWRGTPARPGAGRIAAVAYGPGGLTVTLRGGRPVPVTAVASGGALWPRAYRPADDGRGWIGRRAAFAGTDARRVLTIEASN